MLEIMPEPNDQSSMRDVDVTKTGALAAIVCPLVAGPPENLEERFLKGKKKTTNKNT